MGLYPALKLSFYRWVIRSVSRQAKASSLRRGQRQSRRSDGSSSVLSGWKRHRLNAAGGIEVDTLTTILAIIFGISMLFAARGLIIGAVAAFIFLKVVNWVFGWRLVQRLVAWVGGWFSSMTPNLDLSASFVANLIALMIFGLIAASFYEESTT